MAKILLPFHSYQMKSPQAASRRLVNCYAEQTPTHGKAPLALMRAPGIESWVSLSATAIRGMCVHASTLYVVAGESLYSVSSAGASSNLGAIPGTERVSMASNGLQLVIVSNPDAYIWDGTLTQITDADFTSRGAAQVAILDSFALFIEPNSGRFFHSDLLAAESYDSLNFATAEAYPDNLVALLVDHAEVFLFGTDSVEIWYNAGTAGSPFAREQNGIIEVGCGAAYSPAKADNTVFWLDSNRIARKLTDLVPTRISTHALEQQWARYTRIDDAFSFAYTHEGHHFWCLTFPTGTGTETGGDTFVFDIATGEWHERRSRDANGSGREGPWRACFHAFCYGRNIVGDQAHIGAQVGTARIGFVNGNTCTEFGELQRMEWTYPSVYAEGRRAFHKRLQIDCQSGTGLETGQGMIPEILLSVSDDGGTTFLPIPNRSTGELGQYRTRSTWTRLGSSYDRVYRASISDPVSVTVWDTQLEIEGGRL